MSTLCAVRVGERARGKIEWLCIQECWNPEVVIARGTAACYRRATVGSSHDDLLPDNPTLHTGAVRPHPGFVKSLLFISPRNGLARRFSKCCQFFREFRGRTFLRGDSAAIFSVGPMRQKKGTICAASAGWLLLNLLVHLLLGEENSALSPRWL